MRMRDHTGVSHVHMDEMDGLGMDLGEDIVLDKKSMRKEKVKHKREPLYKKLGESALAPPKSERKFLILSCSPAETLERKGIP